MLQNVQNVILVLDSTPMNIYINDYLSYILVLSVYREQSAAQSYCETNFGAHLPIVNTPEEFTTITQELNVMTLPNHLELWVGGHTSSLHSGSIDTTIVQNEGYEYL